MQPESIGKGIQLSASIIIHLFPPLIFPPFFVPETPFLKQSSHMCFVTEQDKTSEVDLQRYELCLRL